MRVKSALFLCTALMAGCATSAPPSPANNGSIFSVQTPPADLTAFSLVYTDRGLVTPRAATLAQSADILVGYDVVFIGEMHRHPGNHLAQMQLFRSIHERASNVSLSMEQFERDVQPVVDDYLAGRTGERLFIEKARAWGNYRTSYRPLVEYAKEHGLPVIASNAPEEVVRCVGLEGRVFLDRMAPHQRNWVAKTLSLGAGAYRDKFMGFVQGDAAHGGDPDAEENDEAKTPSENALRSYAAQVTRDDTMAASITRHLAAHPGRKVVHLNGSFHSDSFLGTVERVKARRPEAKIAVVSPYTVESGGDVALDSENFASGTFILLIQELPEAYASDEEMRAAIKRQMDSREERVCEL
jgi:uncharacterized iron-regulated protein